MDAVTISQELSIQARLAGVTFIERLLTYLELVNTLERFLIIDVRDTGQSSLVRHDHMGMRFDNNLTMNHRRNCPEHGRQICLENLLGRKEAIAGAAACGQ